MPKFLKAAECLKSVRTLMLLFRWVRYGLVSEEVKERDGGFDSEISFTGRFGREIGYFAYGYFNPACPYQGEEVWMRRSPSKPKRLSACLKSLAAIARAVWRWKK